jgi:hypothetical protein
MPVKTQWRDLKQHLRSAGFFAPFAAFAPFLQNVPLPCIYWLNKAKNNSRPFPASLINSGREPEKTQAAAWIKSMGRKKI